MNQVLRVLSKIGEYIYRNSVWLVPLVETTYKAVRKIIKRKKDERTTENKDQGGSGEG
jgi:hypothetical protein